MLCYAAQFSDTQCAQCFAMKSGDTRLVQCQATEAGHGNDIINETVSQSYVERAELG